MRRFVSLGVAIAVLVGFLGGWSVAPAAAKASTRTAVVAAFYPVAYAAQQVGGRYVKVTNLTPAGAEPHDLDLTPDQRDLVDDAKVVFVLGHGFQPAVEKAASERDGTTVELLDKLPIGARGKRVAEADSGNPDALDPHVWLDPALMTDIVAAVATALERAAPVHKAAFAANAARLEARLARLDDRFRSGLASCRRKVIVTSHEAFGYLAKAFGLKQQGVAGLSPDTEPDAQRIADLADLVRRDGVTTIFTEELVSPRIAQTLAREAGGVKTAVLSPLEGLTPEESKAHADYFTQMDANLAKLRAALDCA